MSDLEQGKEWGRIAYEAYFEQSKGVSLISGFPLPQWNDQSEKIKQAWKAAALAVLAEFAE
jgi:hypothetical protein